MQLLNYPTGHCSMPTVTFVFQIIILVLSRELILIQAMQAKKEQMSQ